METATDLMDELDVEDFAKNQPEDQEKPRARVYVIRIDRETKRVSESELSGTQYLALVDKTPATHKLFQKFRGGRIEVVKPDQIVSFVAPGVERFQTIPKDTTEGTCELELRKQFELPEEDVEFLDARGLPWESVAEGKAQWALLHDYLLPAGYNHAAVSVALQLSPSYPETQIDMAYFHPHLARSDGKSIPQLTNQALDGKTWQRWSRHRTNANPWRRGYDCIQTHLLLVDEWLERELQR